MSYVSCDHSNYSPPGTKKPRYATAAVCRLLQVNVFGLYIYIHTRTNMSRHFCHGLIADPTFRRGGDNYIFMNNCLYRTVTVSVLVIRNKLRFNWAANAKRFRNSVVKIQSLYLLGGTEEYQRQILSKDSRSLPKIKPCKTKIENTSSYL
jgi:hypothetical protein